MLLCAAYTQAGAINDDYNHVLNGQVPLTKELVEEIYQRFKLEYSSELRPSAKMGSEDEGRRI